MQLPYDSSHLFIHTSSNASKAAHFSYAWPVRSSSQLVPAAVVRTQHEPQKKSRVAENYAPLFYSNDDDDVMANAFTRGSPPLPRWTAAEDMAIMVVQRLGTRWPEIAALLPGRTGDAVRNRWHRLQMAQVLADTDEGRAVTDLMLPQDPEEDVAAAQQAAAQQAAAIEEKGRAPWSAEEDATLLEGVRRHGCRWRVIVASLLGRSDSSTRNRYNRLLREGAPHLPEPLGMTTTAATASRARAVAPAAAAAAGGGRSSSSASTHASAASRSSPSSEHSLSEELSAELPMVADDTALHRPSPHDSERAYGAGADASEDSMSTKTPTPPHDPYGGAADDDHQADYDLDGLASFIDAGDDGVLDLFVSGVLQEFDDHAAACDAASAAAAAACASPRRAAAAAAAAPAAGAGAHTAPAHAAYYAAPPPATPPSPPPTPAPPARRAPLVPARRAADLAAALAAVAARLQPARRRRLPRRARA